MAAMYVPATLSMEAIRSDIPSDHLFILTDTVGLIGRQVMRRRLGGASYP